MDGEPEGIWPMPPDLAVEIISPYDLYEKVISKVEEYLAGGVRQVWLISPKHKTITIYASPTHTTILTEDEDILRPAKKSLGVKTGAEAIRMSVGLTLSAIRQWCSGSCAGRHGRVRASAW